MLVVADSSALVALAVCDALLLLDHLFAEVRVPPAVLRECTVSGKPAADVLEAYLRDKVATVDLNAFVIAALDLGRGELEAMALSKRIGCSWTTASQAHRPPERDRGRRQLGRAGRGKGGRARAGDPAPHRRNSVRHYPTRGPDRGGGARSRGRDSVAPSRPTRARSRQRAPILSAIRPLLAGGKLCPKLRTSRSRPTSACSRGLCGTGAIGVKSAVIVGR